MHENIIEIINHTLSSTWIFILLGLIHIFVLENKTLVKFIKQKKLKTALPIAKRGSYLIIGIGLVICSFVIINTLLDIFVPEEFANLDHTTSNNEGFWATWKSNSTLTGLISVTGILVAGISLILSAGSKWLVTLSKLIVTITVLYLFASVLVAYA